MSTIQKRIVEANRTHVAQASGVTKGMVSLVLSGKKTPSLPVAARMAKAIGVSLDDLHRCLEQMATDTVN